SGWILAREGVVEQDRQTILNKRTYRALEAENDAAQGHVVGAKHRHDLLWRGHLGQRCEPGHLRANDSELATVTFEERLTFGRNQQVGNRGRQEAPQAAETFEFAHLLVHACLEHPVPVGELRGLPLDSVLVRLDSQQRRDPRQEFSLLEWFGDEV